MIKAIIFDIDNTLMNFMRMKRASVDAAAEAMIDAGLKTTKKEFVEKSNGSLCTTGKSIIRTER